MSNLRRYNSNGKDFFITCVTLNRIPILVDNVYEFWKAVDYTKAKIQFEINAWAILPDHFHFIIDPMQSDISRIIKGIKQKFCGLYCSKLGLTSGRVWQHRFWDHIIRNEDDLKKHLDYIHYNPVKHGLTRSPFEYEHSSIRNYLAEGYYQPDWGVMEIVSNKVGFGE
ncbi:MAG: transposase [candidate division Zixibacteria bacterium]|nr:transposase [candidate division Zixibacteria bacterium]